MKFVCANADLVSNVNLDTDYDYITASSKSLIIAVETLANSFAKSKNDCVLFVWNTSDPDDLVRATEEASVENVNFKKIINDLEKNLDYSILGDFDLESIELENGMTISVVKYVTMNNFVESKKSARKSIKEAKVMSYDEFKKIVKKEFTKDEIEGFGKTDNGYGVYVIAYGEKEIEIMCDDLRQYGFECKWWHSSDPEDDEPIYFIETIPIMKESKKSARKSLREMFDNEGIVDDFVDFLIYDCGYDEKTVEKYFYKKYKLNGLDVIPIKLYIQIKNEIEDVLGYNDVI